MYISVYVHSVGIFLRDANDFIVSCYSISAMWVCGFNRTKIEKQEKSWHTKAPKNRLNLFNIRLTPGYV